jgi:hypothetical protein
LVDNVFFEERRAIEDPSGCASHFNDGIAIRLAPKLTEVIPARDRETKGSAQLRGKRRLARGGTPDDDYSVEACARW